MRMSPQAEQFKKCLPEELQKVAEVSFSYQLFWKIVSDHLQTLYGKYANPQYCLDAYFNSDEYQKQCQVIRRCPDLPLIGMDDIQRMLSEEKDYARTVSELIALQQKGEDDENINRLASLLGIFPDNNPRALYRYLIAKEHIPESTWPKIRERVSKNRNLLTVITNVLTKTFLPGYLLDFPAAGCVMTQPRSRYYYRGENAYFRASKASCFRSIDATKPASIRAFIDRIRLYQCWEVLDQFEAVRHWGLCEVNYLALAQHYGFRTQMMDITSDLKTAIFFACCEFGADRKWHPLTDKDFSHRNSRKRISSDCGGDSRYGVLYRSPSEITDLRWAAEPEDAAFEMIIPVGYQPFMRCSQQHGYMLLTQPDYDLFKDKNFDKFKFRLTEELCYWIYEEMKQGSDIYPNDDVPDISLEFESLNNQKNISMDVFENAVQDFQLQGEDVDNAKAVLKQYGFTLEDKVSVIMPEKLLQINQNYSAQYAMQKIGITPQLSPIITISNSSDTL